MIEQTAKEINVHKEKGYKSQKRKLIKNFGQKSPNRKVQIEKGLKFQFLENSMQKRVIKVHKGRAKQKRDGKIQIEQFVKGRKEIGREIGPKRLKKYIQARSLGKSYGSRILFWSRKKIFLLLTKTKSETEMPIKFNASSRPFPCLYLHFHNS